MANDKDLLEFRVMKIFNDVDIDNSKTLDF